LPDPAGPSSRDHGAGHRLPRRQLPEDAKKPGKLPDRVGALSSTPATEPGDRAEHRKAVISAASNAPLRSRGDAADRNPSASPCVPADPAQAPTTPIRSLSLTRFAA
jgi:hypothetical protein